MFVRGFSHIGGNVDALDELRKECKKLGHGSIKSTTIIKDGIPVEVVMEKVTKKLRVKK